MTPTGLSRLPHPAGVVGALAGAAIALAPGSLPRDVVVHGALVTVFLLLGAGIGTAIGRALPIRRRTVGSRARTWVIGVGMTVFSAMVAANMWWQDTLRSALGIPSVGISWVAASFAPVVLYVAFLRAPRITAVVVATVAATALGLAPASAGSTGGLTRAAEFEATAVGPASLRLYSSLDGGAVGDRATRLVNRWSAAHGADKAAVVVAVPTGSGWVDPDAMRGFDERLHGDVGVIALQYSDIPSWKAFVSGTDSARTSAIAVTDALFRAVDRLPVAQRPQIYLYGQSLGAIGADAARQWAAGLAVTDRRASICATVLAGPPAGTVALHARDRVVLANASDPVVRWSPRLIWQPPTRWPTPVDLPRPVWLPVAGFVEASADLLGALSFPAGHGHQYGTEQGTVAPLCTGSASGADQTSAPRAAS